MKSYSSEAPTAAKCLTQMCLLPFRQRLEPLKVPLSESPEATGLVAKPGGGAGLLTTYPGSFQREIFNSAPHHHPALKVTAACRGEIQLGSSAPLVQTGPVNAGWAVVEV